MLKSSCHSEDMSAAHTSTPTVTLTLTQSEADTLAWLLEYEERGGQIGDDIRSLRTKVKAAVQS